MDIILLAVTVISLGIALVMSVAAWRVTRDEKKRSSARVAALSLAAGADDSRPNANPIGFDARTEKPIAKAPWAPAPFDSPNLASAKFDSLRAVDMPLNQPSPSVSVRAETSVRSAEPSISHASGFLGAAEVERDSSSGRQKSLAFAALILFVALSRGLVWMMSGPRGTSAAALGPNAPLELVSLSHQRLNDKLAVSGLVRNPVAGQPIERLTAVVFLFDRMGTFVSSSKASVDFLKLRAGDESPFVVSLDAPSTVTRYRVSFRTDEGIVPHIDRRGETATAGSQESTVKSQVVSQQ